MKNTLLEIKKFLKSEVEKTGDKIRFGKVDNDKLFATITREDGKKVEVYWKLDTNELYSKGVQLATVWYYNVKNGV